MRRIRHSVLFVYVNSRQNRVGIFRSKNMGDVKSNILMRGFLIGFHSTQPTHYTDVAPTGLKREDRAFFYTDAVPMGPKNGE